MFIKCGARYVSLFVLLIVVMSLAGCAPALETPYAVTQAPLASIPAAVGDFNRIIILIPEDPTAFNGVVADTGYNQMAMELVMLGLADADPYGNVFPELAAELLTVENGGVTLDEANGTMDVTWKMRKDVTWADGVPVTADDVLFTWDALSDPDTGMWVQGMDYTDSVEKIDDYTFVVHYNSIYPAYLLHFGGEDLAIFPAHYCDRDQGFTSWNCNTKPLSNGPYILKEWQAGDHLSFVRNPSYYKKGQPNIEQIDVKIVPEKETQQAMLIDGRADVIIWATEEMIANLVGVSNVQVSISATNRWSMRLYPNLAARGTIDSQASPHPILSDVRVRRAIRMAIDVDRIIKEAWQGYPTPQWTEFYRPPYVCNIVQPIFDPQAAAALLEEAGWKDTNWDGVRECRGCSTAEPGYRMAMELATYSEYGPSLEKTQQMIAEMLKKIGIALD